MLYFREYMISISAVLVFSVFVTEIMVDISWNKYVNFACGILFIITALSPVKLLLLDDFNMNSAYNKNKKNVDYIHDEIISSFSMNLEKTIKEDIKKTFSKDINIDIMLSDDSQLVITVYSSITDEMYKHLKNKCYTCQ